LIQKTNFIYDFIYDDPALEPLILSIVDSAKIDDSLASNTFITPDSLFSFNYPSNWDLNSKKLPNSKYASIELRSPDFETKESSESSTYEKPFKGTTIDITVKDSEETDIRKLFNSSQMLSAITDNIKETEWNKNIILEYDFGFEGNTASIAEFIMDGKLYIYKYRYADEETKATDYETLLNIIKSTKFINKKTK
jgi:hypothetical protein